MFDDRRPVGKRDSGADSIARYPVERRWLSRVVVCVIGCAGAAAVADSGSGLAACRPITDDGRRLACYDALSQPVLTTPPAAKPAAATASAPATGSAKTEALAANGDTAVVEPTAVVGSAPAAPAPVTPPSAAVSTQNFGADTLTKRFEDEGALTLNTHLVGSLDGVPRGTVFQLDNGQVWHSVDDHEYDYEADNPAVTIERNSVGSYWMHLEHAHFNLRVSRLK